MGKSDAGRIDARALAHALVKAGLEVESLTFTPSWEGTSYVGRDRSGGGYFVKAFDPEWRPAHLEVTLEATLALHAGCGLPAVVPPIRLADGELVHEFGEHGVVVFELIDGRPLADGSVTSADLGDIAEFVRMLHRSGECLRMVGTRHLPNDTFTPGIALLERVQEAAARESSDHAVAREAASLIRLATDEIVEAVARIRKFEDRGGGVPTHGDLNLGNFLRQPDGVLRVIDWTKLALGPRERDLLPFTDERFPVFLRTYAGRDGVRLDLAKFEHYILRERLASMIDYGSLLLLERGTDEDNSHALSELRRVVAMGRDATDGMLSWIKDCIRDLV